MKHHSILSKMNGLQLTHNTYLAGKMKINVSLVSKINV